MRTNDAQMLVLTALADGPLHGYAVNTAIERMTGARLGRGSLSGALTRLHGKGLVEYLDGEGRRRPLRLTPAGRELLTGEARSLARVADRIFETAVPNRIHYQDRLAATDLTRAYRQTALTSLDLRPGHHVLDLGCGPGTGLSPLDAATGPTGRVIGIDHDPAMVREARDRTAALRSTTVLQADVHALPLPAQSVDRIRTDRLLQHVADVPRVLAEAVRVLRPGGLLVAAEPDWETLAVDHPDPALPRAYTRHLCERIVRNPTVGRQLPRLAGDLGMAAPSVIPVTSVFRDVRTADRVLGLQRNTERAVSSGHFTRAQADAWLSHLARGPFLATVTLLVVTIGAGPATTTTALDDTA
ncbi:methyltransferase domain-containing protein [Kitasatospora sp. NPDC096147]|uniref:methyltransferase domain-containing protein n=1 Tax=Kitasatospora sp. NPDC096147 TaxID=3364093 RepID=UPI00382891D7